MKDFQFSLWDSCPAAPGVMKFHTFSFNSLYEILFLKLLLHLQLLSSFQFSLWDSIKIKLIGTSIGKFPFNSLYEILQKNKEMVRKWMKKSFNSLYEIRNKIVVNINIRKEDFQFSLWDSAIRYNFPKGTYPELSILFMRFPINNIAIKEKIRNTFNSLYEILTHLNIPPP